MSEQRKTIKTSRWFDEKGEPLDAKTHRELDEHWKKIMARQMELIKKDFADG